MSNPNPTPPATMLRWHEHDLPTRFGMAAVLAASFFLGACGMITLAKPNVFNGWAVPFVIALGAGWVWIQSRVTNLPQYEPPRPRDR